MDIAIERNGVHLHLACPTCLDEDGKSELRKKHLTINASKGSDKAVLCHKHEGEASHRFTIPELLNFPTLAERGITTFGKNGGVARSASANPNNFEMGPDGYIVPKKPGKCTHVTHLEKDHPAIEYLRNRGFTDLPALVDRYGLSLCTEPNPTKKYARLPLGFTNAPVGQLVFFIEVNGRYKGWQSRLIEKVDGHKKFVLGPDCTNWVHVQDYNEATGKWEGLADPSYRPSEGYDNKWHMSKYTLSPGVFKQDIFMGYDACVRWNEARSLAGLPRVVVLVEGVLDAAALGYPALPMLGNSLSNMHMRLIRDIIRPCVQEAQPDLLLYVFDNDEKGKASMSQILERFQDIQGGPPLAVHTVQPPAGRKDVGELGDTEGKMWLDAVIKMVEENNKQKN